ncbi:MAG: hypothetical protein KatS3mg068_0612 [Candidatus Sericytochromatia bacterium]|nr:MAG: hypothetical protein KatS3mg068_0612 [Candidatus Sericytochromatia bacterium]
MEIPKSLENTWNSVISDNKITKSEYKSLVDAAMPSGSPNELEQDEEQFLLTLKSDLEKNGIARGDVPVSALSFSFSNQNTENINAQQNNNQQQNVEASNNSSFLPSPNFPEVKILLNWPGYNKEVNTAFTKAFNEPKPVGNKVPVLSSSKANNIVEALGFGTVKQLQQQVGAKQDNKFGPETFFRTKAYVATQINNSYEVEKLNQLKSILNVLGNDDDVGKMKVVVDQRIQVASEYQANKQKIETYFNNVNQILGSTDPKNMEALLNAKNKLQKEFDDLPSKIKAIPEVADVHKKAMQTVENAIKALENEGIGKQKAELSGKINNIVNESVTEGLKTGDTSKVTAGKDKINKELDNYPKVKDSDEIKNVVKQANEVLDNAVKKINDINNLIAKKDWTSEDKALADKYMSELPAGTLKDKLAKAIEAQSDAAKLKEKNRANLPTVREGLKDVIGNGFFNLENSDGTKGMLQLIAKQGLLDEAITKMNVDDQTRAIKILTKDIKFDKMSNSDKFNLAIARKIYENLSKSANVDDDIKKKVLPHLKKEVAPNDFSSFEIDDKTYINGMKFAIGSDRIGSEQEAALTMARAIMNGEVSNKLLGQLNRYELNDLTKFIEKKAGKEEKDFFLKNTVASAYNNGVAVNIESLDRAEKAKVIKGVLDIDNVNESKVSDLLKKAGKKTIFETVNNENLSDKQLAIIGKHVNGDDMADEPKVGAKILGGMIRTYNKDQENSPVKIENIRKYIDQVDNDWWEDDDTMKLVINELGDGPGSEYEKFQKLAPATLDRIRQIADY